MHMIAFDLDGTLADSEAFAGELYVQAVQTALGIEIEADWSGYRHRTDSGILDEIIDRSELNADRSSIHLAVKKAMTDLVANYVAARDSRIPEIPGASAFVRQLIRHPSVRVAVATGGWEETALIKLSAIGIDPQQMPIATSSDAVSKADIMRIAERRALPSGGVTRRTYFGDSPYDKEVSRTLRYNFIAIGDRVQHRPRYSDFRETESLLEELGLR